MILKLKRTPGIYLVGFMAAGKSTVGRMLADELGWTFIDIDDDIEAQEQTSIAEIFEIRGEEAFREIETAVICKRVQMVQRGRPTVVALGGGAFTRDPNYELLEDNGVTVWLDCPLKVVEQRWRKTAYGRWLAISTGCAACISSGRRHTRKPTSTWMRPVLPTGRWHCFSSSRFSNTMVGRGEKPLAYARGSERRRGSQRRAGSECGRALTDVDRAAR